MEAFCGTTILQVVPSWTRPQLPKNRSLAGYCSGRHFRVKDRICNERGMMIIHNRSLFTRRFFVNASVQNEKVSTDSQDGPIRIGILGCANIARKLSRAISLAFPDAIVYAVASRSIDKARRFVATNGLPAATKQYGSYEELLEDPAVEAVYVPLPTALHLQWAVLAANKKKHILLEKPVALSVAELDRILEACESNGVQFMDGTMWVHHPRTRMMEEFFKDDQKFGKLKNIQSIFTFYASDNFLQNNIRVNPNLDALGSLGDVGWYCIRASLLASNYELPKLVTAMPSAIINESGVILSCGASLVWPNGVQATFQCSFLSHLTMDLTAIGTKGTLRVTDFNIPRQENAATFSTTSNTSFTDLEVGWGPEPSVHTVVTEFPQEVIMVKAFLGLVRSVIRNGSEPERKWGVITRQTQAVMDAVRVSIERGYEPIEVVF